MDRTQRVMLVCFLFALTALSSAQTRKPGLWELSTTTTWQQSPMGNANPSAGSRTLLSFVSASSISTSTAPSFHRSKIVGSLSSARAQTA